MAGSTIAARRQRARTVRRREDATRGMIQPIIEEKSGDLEGDEDNNQEEGLEGGGRETIEKLEEKYKELMTKWRNTWMMNMHSRTGNHPLSRRRNNQPPRSSRGIRLHTHPMRPGVSIVWPQELLEVHTHQKAGKP